MLYLFTLYFYIIYSSVQTLLSFSFGSFTSLCNLHLVLCLTFSWSGSCFEYQLWFCFHKQLVYIFEYFCFNRNYWASETENMMQSKASFIMIFFCVSTEHHCHTALYGLKLKLSMLHFWTHISDVKAGISLLHNKTCQKIDTVLRKRWVIHHHRQTFTLSLHPTFEHVSKLCTQKRWGENHQHPPTLKPNRRIECINIYAGSLDRWNWYWNSKHWIVLSHCKYCATVPKHP